MLRSTMIHLTAAAAVLMAATGCNLEALDTSDGMRPVAAAMETPPLGHELHRMFEAEKRAAPFTELPAQF
jgi:hypothetical protein